jgi:hypothetical protein
MSVCQQAIRRRTERRLARPKGLRAVSRTRKSLLGFEGKVSKTARKSGAK